ncbi:MAG: hypothetical protein J5I81_03370 [Nitrococcus mobilis]|nr:hypothetical protein [Nitrococcus mobilis]
MQQDSANHSRPEWAQGLLYDLLAGQGALAILLAAGWSALAAFARDSEASTILDEHLHQALEQLREEITRSVEAGNFLLDLARQLLPVDRLAPPFAASFAYFPAHPYPNIGPLQKEQANLEALQRTLDGYQTAALNYTRALSELYEAVLSEYRQELADGVLPESTARSTRELYDHWLEVAERTYERFLHSETYPQAISDLLNAWADLRLALQPVLDELLAYLGLPTRREVEDTQRHLDRLRRQQRADTIRLQCEVTALRNELAALRDTILGPPPPTSRSGKDGRR